MNAPELGVGELRLSSERQARRAWLDSKRSRDSAAQMAGRQAEMSEDLSDHCGLFDSGDDFQFATAVRAVFDVDIEHPFQQSCPADANRRRGMGRVVLRIGSVRFDFLRVRNDFGTVFGVGVR